MTSVAVAQGVQQRRWSLATAARSGLAAWVIVGLLVLGVTVRDAAGFWMPSNVADVLTATVVLGLVALGQHLVVLTGGIDLAVGSMATLSSLLTAILINGYPIRTVPVILAMVALGALVGSGHGLLVARIGLAPFVVTLATFYLLQGVAFMISTTPTGQVTSALENIGLRRTGPIPWSLPILVMAAALVGGTLRTTAFGRHIYAVGGDQAAARSNGVPVRRTLVLAYAGSAALAALAGVVLAARATVGSPTAGHGLELSAITVVVIGGTSLLGGRGSLVGTLGGVTLLALVESSFTLLQFPATLSDLVRGVVILAAAAIFVTRNRR